MFFSPAKRRIKARSETTTNFPWPFISLSLPSPPPPPPPFLARLSRPQKLVQTGISVKHGNIPARLHAVGQNRKILLTCFPKDEGEPGLSPSK